VVSKAIVYMFTRSSDTVEMPNVSNKVSIVLHFLFYLVVVADCYEGPDAGERAFVLEGDTQPKYGAHCAMPTGMPLAEFS
jgi:hypothetical protein